MAGDERTGVSIMRLTEGLDSGPVALREEVEIGPEDDFGALSERLAELGGGSARAGPRPAGRGPAGARGAGRGGGHLRREDRARRAPPRPRPAGGRAGPAGPRPDPARRRLPARLDEDCGSACAGRAPVDGELARGRAARPSGRRAAARLRRGRAARSRSVQPAGGKPMAADAYLRGHPLPSAEQRRGSRRPGRSPTKSCGRPSSRTPTPSAPSARPAAVRRVGGRERAQAQRLAYGAVQRRGTSDAAIETPRRALAAAARPAGDRRPAARPLRAALRRRHPRPRRRRPGGRAGQGGRGGARRRPRQRGPAPRRPRARRSSAEALLGDDSTPELAAVAHSAPLWLARMWWEELGAEGARSLLAACNEPAEVALPGLDAGSTARRMIATLRRVRGRGRAPPQGPWPLAPPESIVIEGRTGEDVPARVAAGELTPQSRGSAAVVEVLDPQPGRPRPRPLRRAGDQDRPDRGADGGPRRGDLGRARRGAGGRSRRPGAAPRACAASP